MHIHKFADLAVFDEVGIGGTIPATKEYREVLKKLHPTQILTGYLNVPLYRVRYTYITSRGNSRRTNKYILLRLIHEDVDLEIDMALQDWVDEQNKTYPYRKISNVKILEIKLIAYAKLSLTA